MIRICSAVASLLFAVTCINAQPHLTVYDIQHTADSLGNSLYNRQVVSTGGIVTATGYTGPPHYYFISDREGGLWHGIFVFDAVDRGLAVGDSISFRAEVREIASETWLRNVVAGSVTVVSGAGMVPPAVISCDSVGEAAEGVLVELRNVVVTEVSGTQFRVRDATGSVVVGRDGWPYSVTVSVGDTLRFLRGIVTGAANNFVLNPRGDADFGFASDRPPVISNVRNRPPAPTILQSDTITATITDESYVADARVYYRFGGSGDFLFVLMYDDGLHGDGLANDDVWGGIIPASLSPVTCYYYIAATDSGGRTATSPTSAPQNTYSYITATPMSDLYDRFQQYENTVVTLAGVVTFVQDVTTTSGARRISAYMQDESGRGFYLSQSGAASNYPGIQRGNFITIRGTVTVYQGTIQLGGFSSSDITVLQRGAALPAPVIVATGDRRLQAQLVRTSVAGYFGAGTWCRTSGTIYRVDENIGGGTNISLDDGSGNLVIRVWDDMGLDSVTLGDRRLRLRDLVGQTCFIWGVASTYRNDFQLLAGYEEDFALAPVGPPAAALTLEVPNRPFAPDIGQRLTIRYAAPAGGQVRLRVFDLRGRLVHTLVDKPSGGPNLIAIEWDGRNELRELLPMGTYVLHLESVRAGNSDVVTKPVVIGTKL